jgi:hypothetical protein
MEHEIDKNGKRNRKKEGHEPIREKDLKVGRKTLREKIEIQTRKQTNK